MPRIAFAIVVLALLGAGLWRHARTVPVDLSDDRVRHQRKDRHEAQRYTRCVRRAREDQDWCNSHCREFFSNERLGNCFADCTVEYLTDMKDCDEVRPRGRVVPMDRFY